MVSNDDQGCIVLFTAAHIRAASIVWITNKNILVQILSSLIQSSGILQKRALERANPCPEISFSSWPAHMKMAFLPLGLKTFYLKQLLFPWLLRRCKILFFSLNVYDFVEVWSSPQGAS